MSTEAKKMISSREVSIQLTEALSRAGREVPEDIFNAVSEAKKGEEGPAKEVLSAILKNMDLAKETGLPLCQDTGMVLFFVKVGEGVVLSPNDNGKRESIKELLYRVTEEVYRVNYFRKSVVSEPLFERENTKTNLPPLIHWEVVNEAILEISFLLKGFGSENCSRTVMMKPTASVDELKNNILGFVKEAGGSPCPPTVLGLGIGGSIDHAALLSKKALLRDIDERHPDKRYAQLELDLLKGINDLGVGAGGLGGKVTCLGLNIEYAPTHIAGLPVALSVNCWADRKGTLFFKAEEANG